MSAKVSFRVITYLKRPRNEPGLTQRDSKRLTLPQALNWVLTELPVEAVVSDYDEDTDTSTVAICWAKVPAEVKDSLS